MSNTTNTSTSIQSMLYEKYADGKPKFKKVKSSLKKEKCPCSKECNCKKKK